MSQPVPRKKKPSIAIQPAIEQSSILSDETSSVPRPIRRRPKPAVAISAPVEESVQGEEVVGE
jgi:hypothetical protein